ncbi:hypothetical protein [Kribbella swartbergensis]
MYWLRWFGFSMLGIAIAALLVIPWLRANGRADETGDAIIGSLVAGGIAAACLLWRRDRPS